MKTLFMAFGGLTAVLFLVYLISQCHIVRREADGFLQILRIPLIVLTWPAAFLAWLCKAVACIGVVMCIGTAVWVGGGLLMDMYHDGAFEPGYLFLYLLELGVWFFVCFGGAAVFLSVSRFFLSMETLHYSARRDFLRGRELKRKIREDPDDNICTSGLKIGPPQNGDPKAWEAWFRIEEDRKRKRIAELRAKRIEVSGTPGEYPSVPVKHGRRADDTDPEFSCHDDHLY